jgi:hypothetical protein
LLCCDPIESPIETLRAYYQHSNGQPVDDNLTVGWYYRFLRYGLRVQFFTVKGKRLSSLLGSVHE